jgi:hypothetical protein
VKGNDKHAILEALISSNDKVWGEFKMHPLKINMRLATAAAAQAHGIDIHTNSILKKTYLCKEVLF